MRASVSIAVVLLSALSIVPLRASSIDDEKIFDQQTIDALTAKVNQASPREQCFIYAEIVHQMTEVSLRQYAAGNVEKATGMLQQIQQFAHKIHLSMAGNDKRLKNAEILLRHTAFRLNEMLHSSSYEDRALVEQTLAQVNAAENEAMMQVFRK